MIAKQIVIDGAGFTTRHPFFGPPARSASAPAAPEDRS
jgi:hypothetical protein